VTALPGRSVRSPGAVESRPRPGRPGGNRSRVEGDKSTEHTEPRSDFMNASIDSTDARNDILGCFGSIRPTRGGAGAGPGHHVGHQATLIRLIGHPCSSFHGLAGAHFWGAPRCRFSLPFGGPRTESALPLRGAGRALPASCAGPAPTPRRHGPASCHGIDRATPGPCSARDEDDAIGPGRSKSHGVRMAREPLRVCERIGLKIPDSEIRMSQMPASSWLTFIRNLE
jgi:hypothetical protein